MKAWEALYGPNVGYALELYERYLQDPGSVDAATRAFFDRLGPIENGDSGLVATLARPTTRTPVSSGNGSVASPSGGSNGASAPEAQPTPRPSTPASRPAPAEVARPDVQTVVHA